MDKVEEVKKILEEIDFATLEFDKDDIAKQICQLFEPKPIERRRAEFKTAFVEDEPEPDQSMLTDFTSFLSFKLGEYQGAGLYGNYPENFNKMIPEMAKELLAKTASIVRAEKDKEKIAYGESVGDAMFEAGKAEAEAKCRQKIGTLIEEIWAYQNQSKPNENYAVYLTLEEYQSLKAKYSKEKTDGTMPPNKEWEATPNKEGE